MICRNGLLWWPLLLGAGCVPGTATTALVPTDPFGHVTAAKFPTPAAPTSEAEARRVVLVSQKILKANPRLPVHPQVILIGLPAEEIFHRGSQEIYITEGLSQKCKTESQLAAVLSLELGKMVSEREALNHFRPQRTDQGPPMEVPVGSDYHGAFGPDDGTRMMEMGKYELERKRRQALPPLPETLARVYLHSASYPPEELATVAPLLRAANNNADLEKQFNGRGLPRVDN